MIVLILLPLMNIRNRVERRAKIKRLGVCESFLCYSDRLNYWLNGSCERSLNCQLTEKTPDPIRHADISLRVSAALHLCVKPLISY